MILGEYLQTIGPNRRSEKTVIEQQLLPGGAELEALQHRWHEVREQMLDVLQSSSGCSFETRFTDIIQVDAPLSTLAGLFSQSALALQIAAGHRVGESGFAEDSAGKGVWAWFEYEHDGVGYHASKLAMRLIADDAKSDTPLTESIERFLKFARSRVLPLDAEAIIEAARRRDISCFKLERDPYPGIEGDFRVRPNGMLMLGHCASRHLVDGTLCLTRNAELAKIFRDRQALRQRLVALHAPVPRQSPEAGNCLMARHAIRAAEAIGYPVVVKPGSRARGLDVFLNLESAEAVRNAVDRVRRVSNQVIVEAMVEGESHVILVAAQKPMARICKGEIQPLAPVHESILNLAIATASSLGSGLMAITVVTTEIGSPLAETGGAVVDLDLAPELDQLLISKPELIGKAAEEFVNWLYPKGSESRVPIIAVTGTNGKTTTCRMSSRILQQAGRSPALVCSDGVFFNGEFSATRQDLGHAAHHHVFENPQVDSVVFEEYFGRIARAGFAYSWCDVAVCTNVTADHLGRIGTNTLDEMAALKEEVPRRARHAVVLNADDNHCLAMANRVSATKIGLVSMQCSHEQLETQIPRLTSSCVLEKQGGVDWLVFYDAGLRQPLMAVADIPATFDGTAGHNTSNAMHAALACYLAGTDAVAIARGLSGFEMSFEATPGRLNVFDELPFRVIMDYAHNMDGYRRLCSFTDQQEVEGKKILMFGFTGDRQDRDILEAAGELAGHFDHYVCRNYRIIREREPQEIPALLEAGLKSAGIPAQAISQVPDHMEAMHFSLDMAQPGDLVVLLVGGTEFESAWELLQTRAKSMSSKPSGA